ncbi:hypothetical protein SS50377_25185 [Spironucleus salmonicida]|uniref:Uncharacterized protein n=1 Tax=Spironucleus salmonicida TaxID=348837 RepID=V6M105_9EUKA|nr:hypothetical protein SS50377_25185 [Spironucleus salmonicida]|eukprot:EST46844.1 Hypothetical protein SS50377_13108 [Spironucleus salmonicida]
MPVKNNSYRYIKNKLPMADFQNYQKISLLKQDLGETNQKLNTAVAQMHSDKLKQDFIDTNYMIIIRQLQAQLIDLQSQKEISIETFEENELLRFNAYVLGKNYYFYSTKCEKLQNELQQLKQRIKLFQLDNFVEVDRKNQAITNLAAQLYNCQNLLAQQALIAKFEHPPTHLIQTQQIRCLTLENGQNRLLINQLQAKLQACQSVTQYCDFLETKHHEDSLDREALNDTISGLRKQLERAS